MPRTLAQNAQYIAETIKPAIKQAIEDKGVTVPSTDSFLDYADRIGEISGGGSGYQLKDLPTGSISTVNDAAELPLNALKVSVEAWQEGSGDPSPSNVRPIHGWDSGEIGVVGKNLFDKDNAGIIIGYSINPNPPYNTYPTANWSLVDYLEIKGSETYTATVNSDGTANTTYVLYDADKNPIIGGGGRTFSTPQNAKYIRFDFKINQENYTQLELGSTATAYEPYQGKQYNIDFPQTVYGAEWNVVDGGMKEEYGFEVFDGSDDEGWALSSSAGLRVDTGKLRGIIKNVQGPVVADIECNSFVAKSSASTYAGNIGISVDGSGYLAVSDGSGNMTVEGWKSWLAEHPLQVKYKLATPTTIDLSPLSIRMLEGVNNLYADCGDVLEGEYFVGNNQLYASNIIFAGKGDSGIGSYRKIDTLPTALLNATAMTCEVCARFDSFVNLSSGPYARIITFGNDNQTGRFGPVGLVYDGSSSYDLCVWDDTVNISSGLCVWTPTDTHTVAVVKTTAGTIKIYVDGVLKYTGSSALTITNTLIDYITQRARTNTPSDTQRQINGEVFAWRIYGKELSASQINANFLVDKINYID